MGKYKPSEKSPEVEAMLERLGGRSTAINNDMCVKRPYGCGEPIGPFRDTLSETEYTISGLCQTCQDSIFVNELNDILDELEIVKGEQD